MEIKKEDPSRVIIVPRPQRSMNAGEAPLQPVEAEAAPAPAPKPLDEVPAEEPKEETSAEEED